MKLRIASDLHLEFEDFRFPTMPDEKEQILILAGDIDLIKYQANTVYFFDDVSKRFHSVLMVPGNHEYYFSNIEAKWDLIEWSNIIDLTQTISCCIQGVRFIGATLWTDLNKRSPSAVSTAKASMNDFYKIRGFTHDQWLHKHFEDRKFLENNSRDAVVVTHHAPSLQSVHPKYAGDILNYAFASELGSWYKDAKLWIHGHMHNAIAYDNVICNPKGYPKEDTGFNPYLVYEI